MRSTSTVYPAKVQPGKIKHGVVKCYVTWNVTEKIIEDDEGNTQTIYEHDFGWIDWVLDSADYIERINGKLVLTEDGKVYFEEQADEIVKWVKPVGV